MKQFTRLIIVCILMQFSLTTQTEAEGYPGIGLGATGYLGGANGYLGGYPNAYGPQSQYQTVGANNYGNLNAQNNNYAAGGAQAANQGIGKSATQTTTLDGFKTIDEGKNANAAKNVHSDQNQQVNNKGSQMNAGNYYYKLNTGSLMSCTNLKKFEKEIKNKYYNANSYTQSGLQQSLVSLKSAKQQLQKIIGYAQQQGKLVNGYFKKGAAAASDSYNVGNSNDAINNNMYAGQNQASGANIYMEIDAHLQSTLKNLDDHESKLQLFNMVQTIANPCSQVCDTYGSSFNINTQNDCKNLKALTAQGVGYNYCQTPGLQIGNYIAEGLLTKGQLCYAASCLKYMKSIYQECYNLYSGYTKNQLNSNYASLYARRKQLCGQDELHSEIVSSSNVANANAVNSKSGHNNNVKDVLVNDDVRNNNAEQGAAGVITTGKLIKNQAAAGNQYEVGQGAGINSGRVNDYNQQSGINTYPVYIEYSRPVMSDVSQHPYYNYAYVSEPEANKFNFLQEQSIPLNVYNPIYQNGGLVGGGVYGGNQVYGLGNAAYGNGAYGNEVYGNGVYGNGVYGNGAYGVQYGNPAYGVNPVYGANPVYGGILGGGVGVNTVNQMNNQNGRQNQAWNNQNQMNQQNNNAQRETIQTYSATVPEAQVIPNIPGTVAGNNLPMIGNLLAIGSKEDQALYVPAELPYKIRNNQAICPEGHKSINLPRMRYENMHGNILGYKGHGKNNVRYLAIYKDIPNVNACTRHCDHYKGCRSVVHYRSKRQCYLTPYSYKSAVNHGVLIDSQGASLDLDPQYTHIQREEEGQLYMPAYYPVRTCQKILR